ncbi:hypothetical protein SDC9_162261 [bioreactor metagenome]|uniref:Uncharacterized protein n=1 Tax=bioreactor metagenome TaxID=1076179 RepID=A0A645FMY2_9ZZZZ
MHNLHRDFLGLGKNYGIRIRETKFHIARGHVLHDIGCSGIVEFHIQALLCKISFFLGKV